jgi:hypothetical protein
MKWFAPYRSLAVIYGVVLIIGIGEFVIKRKRPPDHQQIFIDPVHNFPDTVDKLYPQRAENYYFRGRRAEISLPYPFTMLDVQRAQLAAANHYEQCLAAGLRSDENVIYNYALALMRSQSDPARIEVVIQQWRRDFPNTVRRDLADRHKEIQLEFMRMGRGF